jgi:hypothetical protein
MSGGGNQAPSTISTEELRLGNLRVQTSMYGLAQPMVWGQTRVTGNLLWFGNFQAIATTTVTSSGGGGGGGKGGGGGGGGGGVIQSDTKYSYKAAAMLGIARGPILGIGGVWRGKSYFYGGIVEATEEVRTETVSINPGMPSPSHDMPAITVVNVPLSGAYGRLYGVQYIAPTPAYVAPPEYRDTF